MGMLALEDVNRLASQVPQLEEFFAYLRAQRYGLDGISALLKLDDAPDVLLARSAYYSFLCRDELESNASTLSVLARLFFFSIRVPVKVARAALRAAVYKIIEDAGLARPGSAELLEGAVTISEMRSTYFISDQLFTNLGNEGFIPSMADDVTMPAHASSLELFDRLEQDDHLRSFLDLGCGTGCQSILTAARYDRRKGIDLFARSPAFARVNAALAGVDCEYVNGDIFTFEDGQKYDHIAWNTPGIHGLSGPPLARLIDSRLDLLMSIEGVCQLSGIFALSSPRATVSEYFRATLAHADRWKISDRVVEGSPFGLSAENITTGKFPRLSYLITNPQEKGPLLGRLRAAKVSKVVVAVASFKRAP